MVLKKSNSRDFFEDHWLDPVDTAVGSRPLEAVIRKKKAGFYISEELLERFTRKFYELKLAGAAIENKSALLEMALAFALDDLDKDEESDLLQALCPLSRSCMDPLP